MNEAEPVHLVIPSPDPPAHDGIGLAPWFLAGVVIVICGAAALRVRRAGTPSPGGGDRVFIAVARRFGLRRGDREVVKRLADHLRCPPVAVLISADAWTRAREADSGARDGVPSARLERIERLCGFVA